MDPLDALVAHFQNMTKPAKPALAEVGLHSGETSTSQHFFVGNLLLPPNSKNMTEALLVEGVFFFSCTFDRVHVSLPYNRVLQ